MREDAGFRHRVENADIRITQRHADVLERRDRKEHERKRPRFAPEQPSKFKAKHKEVRVRPESRRRDVVIGADMGIPLATDDVMGSEARRKKEDRIREHRRPRDRSWSACSTWRARQSSMSVRSSVDLGYAQLQGRVYLLIQKTGY